MTVETHVGCAGQEEGFEMRELERREVPTSRLAGLHRRHRD